MPDADLPDHASEVAGLAALGLSRMAPARISGAPLRHGNTVSLLRDSAENYPAWLDAIRGAREVIHFENFIVANDETGRLFAEALAERARAGVKVRVLYDWLGCVWRARPAFWRRLRDAGAEVRVFNPPQLASPFWFQRDHRKLLTVDGAVGFVSGLCISDNWPGDPPRREPWRDTGIGLRGPIVADLDDAFAETWAVAGDPLPADTLPRPFLEADALPGEITARAICNRPGEHRTYRLDQLMAATVQRRLWLTDAYFLSTSSYQQALTEAARDGVDVRLLVPGTSDVPFLQPVVQAGYRPLVEAGIRIFEWNGAMLHAKTAVADGRWARIGSTNLNPASWATNWELDVLIEDDGFAAEMEAMYLEDLKNATEILPSPLPRRRRAAIPDGRPQRNRRGDVSRFAAGAIALGHSAGLALKESRLLSATEARSAVSIGLFAIALAGILTFLPQVVITPIVVTLLWFGLALLVRSWRLRQRAQREHARLEALRRRAAILAGRTGASPGSRR